ncbi:hypothetical protein [Tessaracoccus flavus]|uniref:Uncharacterized protein n=1 Tax=Tessaracoccus flavus TaxID=1610493 RepID=A0A1Q2CIG0_9ACTN|nr:hypothetical protein [Tessaracoccus flavus]AQP45835.1 hypothetical protein RPIT_14315 [Tessaracoccus flavus]SDZ15056.1 hypothetical protein SAMN05428934_11245 [Tessaracoccus flavus]
MTLKRRLAAALAAAAMLVWGRVATAAAEEVDMYSNPGGHANNGRLWQTDCEMYSSTVVRCETDIWASVVRYENGRFRTITGWHFNNLTYLPSYRGAWANNPLGVPSDSFTSNGRTWRTECDTAATGSGACRSYIWTNYAAYEGGAYRNKTGWVFNNLVRFAHDQIQPVKTVPPHVLDQVRLDFSGLGPLKAGVSHADLARLGYLTATGHECDAYRETTELRSRGIAVTFGRSDVLVQSRNIFTVDGARPGLSIGSIRGIYGSRFKVEAKENYGRTQYFGSVREGDRELIFRVRGVPDGYGGFEYAPTRTLVDTDVVYEISAGEYTDDVSWGGC